MFFRKSVGAVVFYRSPENKIEYLLLNHGESSRESEYWNFPKGTMEDGESERETARREVVEETGLANLKYLLNFRVSARYFYRYRESEAKGKLFFKTAVFYLAQAGDKNVKISSEHVNYEWLLFAAALERVKRFKGSQRVLKKANKFLNG
ncbi:MAG TPA: diadenosine tetraphosphate hydrolase [Candidatus Portnoybacteria bacterium]|uniref:Bis(5'-nucleosyl)-tetraphosphatase [asymmetrical] n=1 Tax=Candidatus Portnoybacteria bacterium CG02_land_8_20_14_3_00_45_8 TaxID=1974807 RepID=A0A2M7D5U3_9BACT|nr:MAG: diadenosine tetraphosphate hydrolase [Candidatus Portnoybacteria bacterium CG02_land_8_20_14_3_00_45_8]HCX27690.1 diadenosine tetraphosphate hydrolase [Candidatus Portnoybacteria bacterium]